MKRLFIVYVLMVIVTAAGSLLFSNGLNLNGNGSKAIGMGGAFVGLADDFSAAYWNPAGLTQLTAPTIAFFGSDVIPAGKYQFDLLQINAKSVTKHYMSPGLGFFKPISDKVVMGVYAHVPSGTGIKWSGQELKNLSGGKAFVWDSLVGLVNISPAIAVKLTERFSVGATLNINYGLLKLKRPIPQVGQYEEDISGWEVGGTFGMLYKASKKLSFGVTYKTPVSTRLIGTVKIPGAALLGLPASDDAERSAIFPMWLAGGIAFKPNEKLTFTADVQYTNWKDMQVIEMLFYNEGWKTYFQTPANFELKWKDTIQLRAGMEYKVSNALAIRAGVYHDPTPGPERTQNIMLPEITYNFITFGMGYKTKHITMEFALEYGFGKDKDISLSEADPKAGMPGIHQLDVFVPTISLTYQF